MNITDTTMRFLVGGIVGILLVGLLYVSFSGKKQDEKFLDEQTTYNQALQHLKGGQYDQALPLLKEVKKEQPDSVTVNYYTGLALANTGDWMGSAKEFQTVINLNPYKVEDSVFMIQFAEILLNAKKKDEAKVVLKRCQTLPVPKQIPDYQMRVKNLLKQVAVSS